jgi:menaquinone-specific isochorismate synthase
MTTTSIPARLCAVTREVEAGHDLLGDLDGDGFAWSHHGMQLVASGIAARVAPGDAEASLRAIDTTDPLELAGTGPIAVGALPFDPDSRSSMVVPARIAATRDGRAWVTEIGPSASAPAGGTDAPTRFSVSAPGTRAAWQAAVLSALGAIERGDLEKVVLAREVLVEADTPFDVREIARRLAQQQPGCFVYASEGLVGASPELLVRRLGSMVESRPVAGTTVADSEAALRALAASVKDTLEHQFVVESIAHALQRLCDEFEVAPRPDVAVFGPVAHLATPIRGHLRAPAPSALELALLLHPTPAVGGTPRGAALEAIRALERFDRGRYAGPVGWVDARGDGEWAIALRGAELHRTQARLVAGAGIVAGSDPDAEWAETQSKLEPMLRALVRP